MTCKKFIFLLLLSSFSFYAVSQTPLDSIITRLNSLSGNRPAEIIYLQTSKGIYESGEDLWFKAYLLDAQSLLISICSQTLYLQMSCENSGKVVWQEKYPIEEGVVAGHVYVAEDLPEGNYFLEAFTRHSFYADSTGMSAVRKVRIQKNITQGGEYPVKVCESIRLTFFPEGGYLVTGISCRLAFKATNGDGYPVDVKGILYEDDTPLIEFESTHAGMGSLLITPLASKSYRMQLYDGRSFPVSDILSEGITIQLVEHNTDFLEFTISQSDDLPAQSIYMTGQMRGEVYCIAMGLLEKRLKIKIPLADFSSQGIASFTFYDTQWKPVAERLVYVNSDKKLYITAEHEHKSYEIRDKVEVKIKVTDKNGQPVSAHLGISVFDQAYVNPADPVNILTHCYLSSQIRGSIYDPAYYFDEENTDRIQAMDLLMLTQGWRRYVWSEDNYHTRGSEIITDEITGIQTIKKKNFKNTEQLIKVSGPEGNSELIWTDENGYFVVHSDKMKTMRGGYIYLKPMLEEKSTKIKLDDPFSSINKFRQIKKNFYPAFDLNRIKKDETLRSFASPDSVLMFNEIIITGKSQNPFRDKFMGYLNNLAQMELIPWVCVHRGDSFLNDHKEGYTHHPNNTPYYSDMKRPYKRVIPIPGKTYKMIKSEPCGDRYCVVDICYEVYNGPLYTEEELLQKNNMWRTKGYYAYREFYQPDKVDMSSSIPDFRNTLLWAPTVHTDDKGEVTVNFYCSDINTGFIGRIEGFSGDGLLGCAKFNFRVKRPISN